MWQVHRRFQPNFFANKNELSFGPVFSLCIVPAGFSHKSPALNTFIHFSVVIVNSPLSTRKKQSVRVNAAFLRGLGLLLEIQLHHVLF
jgi:hypothetical protein